MRQLLNSDFRVSSITQTDSILRPLVCTSRFSLYFSFSFFFRQNNAFVGHNKLGYFSVAFIVFRQALVVGQAWLDHGFLMRGEDALFTATHVTCLILCDIFRLNVPIEPRLETGSSKRRVSMLRVKVKPSQFFNILKVVVTVEVLTLGNLTHTAS